MPDRVQLWQLVQRQGLPLDMKIQLSLRRIRAWYEHYKGQVCVMTSGGLCSTVMLDLVRREYPHCPAVYCDTGLEFPENREFIKTLKDVVTVKPKMSFKAVIEKYGWPVTTKRNAQYIHEVRVNRRLHPGEYTPMQRRRLTGHRTSGDEYCGMSMISKCHQYLIDAPFNVSDRCCDVMKKRPSRETSKKKGWVPFIGTRTEEGGRREKTYLMVGCNSYHTRQPRSTPIAFWLKDDIWAYIKERGLKYSAVYDMGYERTGCVFCAFGAHLEKPPNRFQRLKETHPRLWQYCMEKLGMAKVLEYCSIPFE